MTEDGNGPSVNIFASFKETLPWISVIGAVIGSVWVVSSMMTAMQTTQSMQSQEIEQLTQQQKNEEVLDTQINTSLAALTQSVADIKASLGHEGG